MWRSSNEKARLQKAGFDHFSDFAAFFGLLTVPKGSSGGAQTEQSSAANPPCHDIVSGAARDHDGIIVTRFRFKIEPVPVFARENRPLFNKKENDPSRGPFQAVSDIDFLLRMFSVHRAVRKVRFRLDALHRKRFSAAVLSLGRAGRRSRRAGRPGPGAGKRMIRALPGAWPQHERRRAVSSAMRPIGTSFGRRGCRRRSK